MNSPPITTFPLNDTHLFVYQKVDVLNHQYKVKLSKHGPDSHKVWIVSVKRDNRSFDKYIRPAVGDLYVMEQGFFQIVNGVQLWSYQIGLRSKM
jgi:hypothetical protein